jgi:fibronectin-binding autotransporter adhesin
MGNLRIASAAFVTAVLACLVASQPAAHGQSGSWAVTTGGLWSNTANWTGGTIADGQGSTATFNQTLAANVTVDLDSPRTLGNLSFTSGTGSIGSWLIANNSDPANVLTLSRSDATAPTLTTATATRAEIATAIAGTGGLNKTGGTSGSTPGVVRLSVANTYSGTTTVSGGVLEVTNGSALGTSSVSVTGGGLHVLGGVTVTGRSLSTASAGNSSDGGLSASGGGVATWAGPVTMANGRLGTVNDSLNTTLVVSGAVTGSGNLDISSYGTGGVVLSAASGQNTYSGSTAILRGRLAIGANNTLPTGTLLDVHYNTATGASQEAIFDLNGFSQQVGRLVNTGNLYGQATVTNSSATAGTLTVNQSVNTTYSGRITGTTSLVKSGAGNLTLAPTLIVNPGSSATQQNTANTFTGTTRVNAGTLTLSAHSGTDSQALSASTFDTDGVGTLSFGTMTSATFGGLSGTGTLTLANASSGAVTLSLGGGNSSGSFGGTLTGAGGLTKVGTGTLTLSGTNTYAGNTAVNAGTLAISSTTTIPGLTTVGRFSVAAGATLATPSSFSDANLEAIVATGNFAANGILGIDTSGGNRVFANSLTGTVGLTVSGGNRVTLSGANALGPIALNGATLVIENTAALAVGTGGTGSITINGGTITSNIPSNYSFNGRSIVVAGAGGTFRNDGGNLLTFGNISGSAPVVFESGAGTIVTNSNTYSGGTTIKPGARIAYTSGTGFGSGPVTIQGGSLRSSQGTPQTLGNDVTLAGNVTFNASGTNVDNNLVFTGPMTLSGGNHTIDVSMSPRPGATGIFFNGVIGDGVNTHGFTKAGPGTLVLGGANTYGGATTVSGGTLLVNGDQSAAAGAVSVASGATLGGSGTVGGATTISGIHSPGNSPGIQTFASDLSYTGGSASVVWELTDNTSTQGSPTAVYDQILVGGDLDFAAATGLSLVFNSSGSTVDWSNEFWGSDRSWTLYDVAGTTSNLGNFTIQTSSWLDSTNAALATARPNASFSLTSSGEDVLLSYVAVPEPESMAAVAAGLAAIAAAFRRRRQRLTAA